MQWMGALGGATFILVSFALGLRLLRLGSRTREIPELAMGLGFVAMGGLGYPLAAVARLAEGLPAGARVAIGIAAQLWMVTGVLAMAVFNWRVFRPGTRWAPSIAGALAVGFLSLFAWQCASDGFSAYALRNQGIYRMSLPLIGVPLWWAAIESFRFHRQLRRRAALGLADPLVSDRVRLWGCASLAAALVNEFSSVAQFAGIDPATSPEAGAVAGSIGMVAAVCLWLAFFPPESYRRRVAARI